VAISEQVNPTAARLISDTVVQATKITHLIVPEEPVSDPFLYRILKRLFDVAVSSIALLILFPLMVAVALAIYLTDRGPILYIAPRVGRFGVPIKFYKFRSMVIDAESQRERLLQFSDAVGSAFKMKADPRITPVGKFLRKYSIDELPQLITVFMGEMSIVGPRPLPMSEGYLCGETNLARYFVKPGLICLREVNGRSRLSFDEWMRLDLHYVRNRGVLLDLKIFMSLLPAVLTADGAY